MSIKTAVVLVGSPRPRGQSTSETLARFLGDRLSLQGVEVQYFRITRLRTERAMSELLAFLAAADAFVLATPLYVDSLPHQVTRVLEDIARRPPREGVRGRGCAMAAIVNCGFPESRHTLVALDICRLFADQAGFAWAGGLGLGGGEAIGARRLKDLGWMTKHVMRALELAADALLAGQDIPQEAVTLMARPLMNARVYTAFGNFGWYRRAWRHGTLRKLRARPFIAGS